MNLDSLPTHVFKSSYKASKFVASEIAKTIKRCEAENRPCVLGLATGSTPKTVYAELIRLHKDEGLSFQNVITFNLDEYYPMESNILQSYHKFMEDFLFRKLIFPEIKSISLMERSKSPRSSLIAMPMRQKLML